MFIVQNLMPAILVTTLTYVTISLNTIKALYRAPSPPDIAPSSPTTHKSLRTNGPCYTAFQFTATLDILPKIAVKKQFRYDSRVWLNVTRVY